MKRSLRLCAAALASLSVTIASACDGGLVDGQSPADSGTSALPGVDASASADGSLEDGASTLDGAADANVDAARDPASACDAIFGALAQRFNDCDGRPVELGIGGSFQRGSMPLFGSGLDDLHAQCEHVATAAAAGKITIDGAKVAECESAIQTLGCNTLIAYGSMGYPDSCNLAIAGTASEGASCYSGLECGPTDTCYTRNCPATCQPVIPISQSCGSSTCTSDETCSRATNTCIPRKTSGSCTQTFDCAAGYACQSTGADSGLSCVAPKRIGASCTVGANECVPGAFCSGAKCTPWPGAGGACGNFNGEQISCLESACSAPAGQRGYTGTGSCEARLPEGSACNHAGKDGSNPCAAGTTCVSGKCTSSACY